MAFSLPVSGRMAMNSSPPYRARISPRPYTFFDQQGNFLEHLIPAQMAVGVVHRLEMIQVKHENGQFAAVAGGMGGMSLKLGF